MAQKRRKAVRKTVYLRARITPAQNSLIQAAADRAGISVSAWSVERLIRAAREEAPGS